MTQAQHLAQLQNAIRRKLDISSIAVLDLYLTVADENGEAALSVRMIMEAIRLSKSSVLRARFDLEKTDFLRTTDKRIGHHIVHRINFSAVTDDTKNGSPVKKSVDYGVTDDTKDRAPGKKYGVTDDTKNGHGVRDEECFGVTDDTVDHITQGGVPNKSVICDDGVTDDTKDFVSLGDIYSESKKESPDRPNLKDSERRKKSKKSQPSFLPAKRLPPTDTETANHDRFYRAYPKHHGHDDSLREFVKLCRRGVDPELLVSRARSVNEALHDECQRLSADARERNQILYQMKNAASWLKSGCFKDPPVIPTRDIDRVRRQDQIQRNIRDQEQRRVQQNPPRLVERKPKPIAVGSPEWHQLQREMGME
jgi:hypothetical protein